MSIRDIVNKGVVNIDNCESEPIHIPGSIQPHGFLLALDRQHHTILYCSENCKDYLGLDINDLLGKAYSSIFDCDDDLNLRSYLDDVGFDASRPYQCSYNKTLYNTTVHIHSNIVLLEFEPFPDGRLELPNLYSQTQKFLSAIQNTHGLKQLCQSVTEEIKRVTGYDRVMVYRFDRQYNGEVYSEAKNEELESFLGLHYPHTDIPVQARELYLRNMLRIIADVDYRPVPVLTKLQDADHASLDLGNAVLRSVSPIHIEYLKNMGVGATLTISLIQEKKLWGLIACHHYSPKNIPHYVRLTALLEGNFLASQIKVREASEQFELTKEIDNKLQRVLANLNNTDIVADYINDKELIQLVNADGAALIFESEVYTNGITPAHQDILKLANWLSEHNYAELVTENLSGIYSHANEIAAHVGGIMYASLNKVKNNCIIWFRMEIEKTINWAGEPHKAIVKNDKGLSPRRSFATWKEVVKGQSKEWMSVEVNAANKCIYALQKQFTLINARNEEEKQRRLSEKLKQANEELSNLNWIGSHDLKEPLRKIQIFASKMLDDDNYSLIPLTTDLVERMRRSAGRMQSLIDDIMNYSRITNIEDHFIPVDLNNIISEVCSELELSIEEKGAVVEAGRLPTIMGISFQLRQLFINLLSNALKFTRPDIAPVIDISAENVAVNGKHYHRVTVKDNGIGFDEKYESTIFKVFQRLNDISTYEGTGIGLAICKKVMETHEGIIQATAMKGEGACFMLFFPMMKEANVMEL